MPLTSQRCRMLVARLGAAMTALVVGAASAQGQSASPAKFTYETGWPASCSVGRQSPVTFVGTQPAPRSEAVAVATEAPLALVRVEAHTADFAFPQKGGSIRVGEAGYSIESFHFHFPVEHQLSKAGGREAASATFELHVKTKDTSGRYAVFAMQFAAADSGTSADDGFFAAVIRGIALTGSGQRIAIPMSGVLGVFAKRPFYSYIGTTTSPNCSPNVTWYVLNMPLPVSATVVAGMHAELKKQGLDATNARLMTFSGPADAGVTLITPKP